MGTRKSKCSNKAIVIVEPRQHEALKAVLTNYDKIMDSSWDLYVFHGASSRSYAAAAVKDIKRRRVFLKALKTDNLTANEYNYLFKQKKFWNRVDAENILVLQTDAVLCGNSKFNIYDFINYDYIGCSINNNTVGSKNVPWWWRDWVKMKRVDSFYGIGGMSFRKKSFMLKWIASNPDVDDIYPEDVFYSEGVALTPNRPMNASVLSKFCTQRKYTRKSFGAHKITDLSAKKDAFAKYCPEIKLIDPSLK
jgi:hypothetical protein